MLSKYSIQVYEEPNTSHSTEYQCKTDKGALNYAIRWARSVCVKPLNTRCDKWLRSPLGFGHSRQFGSCYVLVSWETSMTNKEVTDDGHSEVGEC